MRKIVYTLILGFASFIGMSQEDYKVGTELYYKDNMLAYRRTNVKVVVKKITEVNQNKNNYLVDKYVLDNDNFYILDSEFTTIGLQELRADGKFTSYHENGKKASEGKAENGSIGSGIWTYYYENGEKRSEEKTAQVHYFSEKTRKSVLNFWDKDGEQTVTNGNGAVEFTNKNGLTEKGAYKNSYKTGVWTGSKDGFKLYEETYKKGNLVSGTSWANSNDNYTYDKLTEPAYYKKKDNSLVKKYIYNEMYKSFTSLEGQMVVNFIISKEGSIKSIDVVRKLTRDYEKEVKRILSEMKWNPAKKRGIPYDSKYVLKLRFNK